MPTRATKICSIHGVRYSTKTCPVHEQRRKKRRTAAQRGYGGKAHRSFRAEVLQRDPFCVLHLAKGVQVQATVADHYPTPRHELVRLGCDPNDPRYGRGLCDHCHRVETAHNQPGGWNLR